MRFRRQHCLKHLAFPAVLHLLTPVPFYLATAYRPVDEPAQVPALKLPGRALFPGFHRAFFNIPARPVPLFSSVLLGEEKQHLPLDVGGNFPPALLKALHCLQGNTKQLCHLALRLSKSAPDMGKLRSVHRTTLPASSTYTTRVRM